MLFLVALLLFQSTDLSAAKHADPVPPEIAAPVAGMISSGGVRATVGANTLTFWFVKQLPAASWSEIKEGTLVGAVKIDKDFRDIRGRVIKAGIYTLRYGIQPRTATISACRRTAISCCSPRPGSTRIPRPAITTAWSSSPRKRSAAHTRPC